MTSENFMNAKDIALESLEFAHKCTIDLLKEFPDDKATYQPAPACNHALWIVGHLAVTDAWFLTMFGHDKSPLPDSYSALFGYQSQPQTSASAYPKFAEVKSNFEAIHKTMVQAVSKMSEDALSKPLGEKGGGFAKDGLDALNKAAWHEGWHSGQLATLRRGLGLKPVF
jgi:hypothetical protein